MSAEDALAVSMLVIFGISGITLLTILCSLMRNAGKKDELAELMAEEPDFEDEPETEPVGGEAEEKQPWEKEADWWKM